MHHDMTLADLADNGNADADPAVNGGGVQRVVKRGGGWPLGWSLELETFAF